MTDDWGWFFSSEQRRTNLLRDEVDSLRVMSSSASNQSARLSSQLATLQGSIETRLDALTVAFDAYVELGDVREQLAGYPDSSAVRRDAVRVVETLSRGASAERVDDRGLGYWLSGAVNALIEVVDGSSPTPGPTDGSPATAGPEAELFVVAAAGALGHGDWVAHRVAALLATDAVLLPRQLVLWAAARDGVFGDVLDEVSTVWAPSLETDPEAWRVWVKDEARSASALDSLRWIDRFLAGELTTPAADAPAAGKPGPEPVDPRLEPLRALVGELIASGFGDEQALLVRSRVLRARIENPSDAPAETQEAATTGPSVTDVVRRSVLDPRVDARTRARLTAWLQPSLLAAARAADAELSRPRVDAVDVHTGMGEFTVGVEGADPAVWQSADDKLAQSSATPPSRVRIPGVVAAATLVLGVIFFAADVTLLGVLFVIVTMVAAVLAVRALRDARAAQSRRADTRQRALAQIDAGRDSAQSVRQARLTDQGEAATLMRTIADRPVVGALVPDRR